MSTDWLKDIHDMHVHYGMDKAVERMDGKTLVEFLKFRFKFLDEELTEGKTASTPDDVIDALIDLVVVALGTIDSFKIDGQLAWERVLKANMSKKVGIKEGRPNPLGLPDLMKPEGWVAPSHEDQRTLLDFVFLEKWVLGDFS
jgi:predicted HAD superfamily Cof-like phosphohydrolase